LEHLELGLAVGEAEHLVIVLLLLDLRIGGGQIRRVLLI
jgi:hypothetical protein